MRKLFFLLAFCLMCTSAYADPWKWMSGYKQDGPDANDVDTDTSSFDNNLSSSDDNVQKALDTIDDLSLGGGTFLDLTDTPASYSGEAASCVLVTGAEDALEFGSCAGGSGGDNVTINSTAIDTTANFLDNIYIEFDPADGGVGGPDDITATFSYPSLTGDHALSADNVIFGDSGLIVEGATADTIELYLSFPDPATTDKTITFQNSTHTVVGRDTTDTLTNKTIDTTNTVTINASDITDQNAGTDITADLEEETHASEHDVGAADSVFPADPGANALYTWDDTASEQDWGTSSDLSYSGSAWTVTDVTCTDCLNATEIEDIYLLNSTSDTMSGTLTTDGLIVGNNESLRFGGAHLSADSVNAVLAANSGGAGLLVVDITDGTITFLDTKYNDCNLETVDGEMICGTDDGGGTVDGSGSADRPAVWTDADTLSFFETYQFDDTNAHLKVGDDITSTVGIAKALTLASTNTGAHGIIIHDTDNSSNSGENVIQFNGSGTNDFLIRSRNTNGADTDLTNQSSSTVLQSNAGKTGGLVLLNSADAPVIIGIGGTDTTDEVARFTSSGLTMADGSVITQGQAHIYADGSTQVFADKDTGVTPLILDYANNQVLVNPICAAGKVLTNSVESEGRMFCVTDSTGSGSLGSNLSSSTDDILSDNGTILLGGTGNTNNETLDFDFETTANTVGVATTSGVTLVDFGTIDLATDALDLSEGNITNAGNIALDSISSDNGTAHIMLDNAGNTTIGGTGGEETLVVNSDADVVEVTGGFIADQYANFLSTVNISGSSTNETVDDQGVVINHTATYTASGAYPINALEVTLTTAGTAANNEPDQVAARITHDDINTGGNDEVRGLDVWSLSSSATENIGLAVLTDTKSDAGFIGTTTGVRIRVDDSDAGTNVNAIGLAIEDVNGNDTAAIYQNSVNDPNYLWGDTVIGGNIDIGTAPVADLEVSNGATSSGRIAIKEDSSNGINYVLIEAPQAITSNITCTLEDDSTPFDSCITAGNTALDDIGDPDAATVIATDDTETITLNMASDGETAFTILLTDGTMAAETVGLLLTTNEISEANYIPLRIQDGAAGAPTTLFEIGGDGAVTTGGDFTFSSDSEIVFSDGNKIQSTGGLITLHDGGTTNSETLQIDTVNGDVLLPRRICLEGEVLTNSTASEGRLICVTDSTGSGSLGSNLSSSTDDILSDNGTILLGGTGNTNNETLDFDFEATANTVGVATTSGVTLVDFGTIDLALGDLDGATGTFSGLVSANANVTIGNGATTAGVLTLLEDTDDGSNFASFQVPALAANTVYTLPADDGDADDVLSTNGSGVLDWVAAGAGSDTNSVKTFVWSASATLPLEAAESIAPITKDTGTNVDALVASYDDSTDECRSVNFIVPTDVQSGSTITFGVLWYSQTATTGDVIWDFRHTGGDTEAEDWDSALTTEAAAADTAQGTVDLLTRTEWTETLTGTGWAADDMVTGLFCRDADNVSDDLVGDSEALTFYVEIPRS
jgi:hypothetical protein